MVTSADGLKATRPANAAKRSGFMEVGDWEGEFNKRKRRKRRFPPSLFFAFVNFCVTVVKSDSVFMVCGGGGRFVR